MALSIFTITIVGIIEAIGTQIRIEKIAEDHTRAVILAQNILEEIRFTNEIQEDTKSGEFEGIESGFKWQYEIRETELEGLYEIDVTVSYSGGSSGREYKTQMLLARRDDPLLQMVSNEQ